jgi:hypothetical protein
MKMGAQTLTKAIVLLNFGSFHILLPGRNVSALHTLWFVMKESDFFEKQWLI